MKKPEEVMDILEARLDRVVPSADHNLREEYEDFAALERACEEFMADADTRPHRATMQPPVIRLAEEHERLHRMPRLPHTLCFGETRKVNPTGTWDLHESAWATATAATDQPELARPSLAGDRRL